MAGYSERPLIAKLGIKPGARVLLANAPDGFEKNLGPMPEGVKRTSPSAEFDFGLLFLKKSSELTNLASLAKKLEPRGMIWVAWPKKSAKANTDLNFDVVQHAGLDLGLVDVKICAIDDFWSGLKFVVRLKDRPVRARNQKTSTRK